MFRHVRNSLVGGLIILLMSFSASSSQTVENRTKSAKMARVEFVNEFIREVEVLYRLQETAKKEFAKDSMANEKLMTSIRMGTRTIMEMNTSIRMLKGITELEEQWNEFRSMLEQSHARRISLSQEIVDMTKKILRGPEPGVNYGDFAARAPELTAQVEQLDKIIFDMSKALFFCLIDEKKVDKDGNLNYLILSRKERSEMVKRIGVAFGSNLDDKNSSRIVSAAWVIKYGLTLPRYKSADEM